MTAKNDITGDKLITKKNSDAYRDNYDMVFRNQHKDRNFDEDGSMKKSRTEL